MEILGGSPNLAGAPILATTGRPGDSSGIGDNFSRTELDAIGLAQFDAPANLRYPGTVERLLRSLTGSTVHNALADPKLEKLRRLAILLRANCVDRASEEIDDALAVGYTLRQISSLVGYFDSEGPGH